MLFPMNTPPASTDLDPKDITRAIARHWRIDVGSMTYLPLGFGSHHWLADVRGYSAQSLFVTADRVASGSAAEVGLRNRTVQQRVIAATAASAQMTGDLP